MHRKSGAMIPLLALIQQQHNVMPHLAVNSIAKRPARSLLARYAVAQRESELALNSQPSTFLITQI